MSYSQLTLIAIVISLLNDRFIFKTSLITKRVFWTSYAIILPFQLLTNWWLTSRNIVMYSDSAIVGIRLASAPIEDLGFGFALVLSVLTFWIYWGRRGLQQR